MAREEGIGGIIFNSRVRTVKCENLGKFADETVPRQGSGCLYSKDNWKAWTALLE